MSATNEAIERVAKALWDHDRAFHRFSTVPYETLFEFRKEEERERARVAIAAIWRPTQEMEDAGYTSKAFAKGTQPGSLSYRPDYIYMAMIGTALGLPEEEWQAESIQRDTELRAALKP